jgi:xylan 1,4-beta-xylosidase
MKYTNPIIPGYYPDPSICCVGADFYLVTSSFEYFPGVPIFHSRDLVSWRQIGYCLTRPSQIPLEGCHPSGGIWAPTLRYHEGIFYMATTNTTGGGHFYVITTDPAGEWSEPVWIPGAGWDASLFFEDEGTAYFQWYEYPAGIFQAKIDVQTGQFLSEPYITWNGTGARSPEGPHLYKINGKYYLIVAEGGTEDCHMISIARSDGVSGPWESCPYNPIVTHRSLDLPIQTTGHGDFVQAPDGSWWIVFLGTRPVGYPRYHILGRETFLAPVTWEAGWPIVNQHQPIQLEMGAALPPAHPWDELEPLRDDFDESVLGLQWNWVRNPILEDYSTTTRPGWLRLTGRAATLNDRTSSTFLGRRQRHIKCRATTRIDFNPRANNEEAGLVVLGDTHHHYEIGITRKGDERLIFVRRRIGSLQAIVAQQPIPAGFAKLSVAADETWYTFSYTSGDDPLTELAQGETRYLCTEAGAAMFTGVYFGMYATGNSQDCQTPADFEYFEIEIGDFKNQNFQSLGSNLHYTTL